MVRMSTLLLGAATLTLGCQSGQATAGDFGHPTVFLRGRGEERLMRGTRPLFIVADSASVGSRTLVAGYEDVPPGDSGLTHMHVNEDELIFVHRGQLSIRLANERYQATAGATVFVPRGTWIGFRNEGADTAGFWFVFNRPAFERCLRALSSRPGEPYHAPSGEDLERINRACDWMVKHG